MLGVVEMKVLVDNIVNLGCQFNAGRATTTNNKTEKLFTLLVGGGPPGINWQPRFTMLSTEPSSPLAQDSTF